MFVGGTRIGSFAEKDTATRNAILVGLARGPKVHLGQLADAFGVTSETLRLLRKLHESEGLRAVLERRRGGRAWRVTKVVRRRLEKLFAEGASISKAHAALGTRSKLSRTTVASIRREWKKQQVTSETRPTPSLAVPVQEELALSPGGSAAGAPAPLAEVQAGSTDGEDSQEARATGPVKSADSVQHLGTWLLVSQVEEFGLYEKALRTAEGRVSESSLRVALDAVVMALALGEQCVEGVRRLATPTAPFLLSATRAPSTTWTRRVLGRLADDGGAAALHLGMVREYLEQARLTASGPGPVFYVDNHMRPYTGKHTLRKGWRMQDKRVEPGASDYYLHDEDGRPIGRITAPAHGSLTDFLTPIAQRLRLAGC